MAEMLEEIMGPPYARSASFAKEVAFAIVLGLLTGVLALGFLNFEEKIPQLWMMDSYDQIEHVKFLQGKWWWLGVTSGTGFVLGVFKVVFVGLDGEVPTFIQEVLHPEHADMKMGVKAYIMSALSLGGGASLGPEAALGAIGGGTGAFCCENVWKDKKELVGFMAMVGMSGTFASLLPIPLLGIVLILEVRKWAMPGGGVGYPLVVFLMTVSGTASYWFYITFANKTYLDVQPLPKAVYDAYDFHGWELAASAAMGIFGALLALVQVVLIGVCKKAYPQVVGHSALAQIMGATMTGLVYGVVGVIMPLTLTSGSHQTSLVMKYYDQLGTGLLLATAFSKMFTLALCNACPAFVGGFVFPILFQGVIWGVLVNRLIPTFDILFTIPTMIGGMMGFLPLLFFTPLLLALWMVLGANGTQNVAIACVSAYTIFNGLGLPGLLIARAAARGGKQHMDGAAVTDHVSGSARSTSKRSARVDDVTDSNDVTI